MPKVFDTVDEFFELNGFTVVRRGKTVQDVSERRTELVNAFWSEKDFVCRSIASFN